MRMARSGCGGGSRCSFVSRQEPEIKRARCALDLLQRLAEFILSRSPFRQPEHSSQLTGIDFDFKHDMVNETRRLVSGFCALPVACSALSSYRNFSESRKIVHKYYKNVHSTECYTVLEN
jgi:hypothetical protein